MVSVRFSWKIDLAGCPGRALGPPCGAFRPRLQKTWKKTTFGDHFSSVFFSIFSICSHDFFLHVFWACLLPGFGWQKHLQAFISKAFGNHFAQSLSKSWKVKTTISRGSGRQNQAFEASISTYFQIFIWIVSGLVFFLRFFAFFEYFLRFDIQFGHHFGQHFAIILTSFFKPFFEVGVGMALVACWGHPGHITGKGGTRDMQEPPRDTQDDPGGTGGRIPTHL